MQSWPSGMYFAGARFSNYEAWLGDPTNVRPGPQLVWAAEECGCGGLGSIYTSVLMVSSKNIDDLRGYAQLSRTTRDLWYVAPRAHDFESAQTGQMQGRAYF